MISDKISSRRSRAELSEAKVWILEPKAKQENKRLRSRHLFSADMISDKISSRRSRAELSEAKVWILEPKGEAGKQAAGSQTFVFCFGKVHC